MRINIYHHEAKHLAERVETISTIADTGIEFFGVRGYTEPPLLHDGPDDDDSSAVTFWCPSNRFGEHDTRQLRAFFGKCLTALDEIDARQERTRADGTA